MKRLFAALFLGLVGALVVASGVASGDILRAVMQILGGGVIGFFAGLLVERKQIQYQRRATVVEELRQRLREAQESLDDMFTPPEYPLDPYWPEEVVEVGEKLDALSDHFEDKGNGLDTKTRELLEGFTDEIAFLWADVRGCLDSGENLCPPLKIDTKTRELLEGFIDEIAFLWADVRGCLDSGENLYPPLKIDTKTRELLEGFTDEIAFLWADVRGCLDSGENLYLPLKAAWDWLNAADEAIEEINERFDRLVGTHTHKFGRSTQKS
jgi:hypothetical protein